MKTVLITGASSGIGSATTSYFLEQGWYVIATVKNQEALLNLPRHEHIKPMVMDVDSVVSMNDAFGVLNEANQRIDVLVNNAGFGLLGPAEQLVSDQIEAQFRTNVFGSIHFTKKIIQLMRPRKSGTIIFISSVMGRVSFPYFSIYASTKWAIEGFAESLQIELAQHDIRVKLVEPGNIKTEFFKNAEKAAESDRYPTWIRVWNNVSGRGSHGADSRSAAKVIFRAATDNSWRMRYSVDSLSKFLPLLRRFMPLRWYQRTLLFFVS